MEKESEDYQREKQALQKSLESVKEKYGNLRMLSENLEAAEKELLQQEKIRSKIIENQKLTC